MVYKISKFGKFLACPGYPECKNTKTIRYETGAKCPKCGGDILIRRSKKGKEYYPCEHMPKCDFIAWYKPVAGRTCPKCGGLLLQKSGKNGKIFCEKEGCGYEEKKEKKSKE